MKLVFICGPFRASTQWGIEQNIHRAERLGFAVANLGAMPVIPHANTRHFHGTLSDQFWLDGTLELLRRCDAMVRVPGWESSAGSHGETIEADRLGLPMFDHLQDLAEWLANAH